MKDINQTTFSFKAINMKGEVLLGLIMVAIIISTFITARYIYCAINPMYSAYNIPFYIILCGIVGSTALGVRVGGFCGKRMSWKWSITIHDKEIYITEKSRVHHVPFDHFRAMYVGTQGMRYLSIKSDKRIRIRVGISTFAPYSTQEDIVMIDNFVAAWEKVLSIQNVKIKKVNAKNGVFEYRFNS